MPIPRLTIYYKADCHLCEDARQVLERVLPYEPFELEEVDITQDRVAHDLYFDKIPVLTVNGQFAFKYRFDEDRLLRRLRNAREDMERDEEEKRKTNEKGAR